MWSSLVARFSRAPCFESPILALQYRGCQLTNCKLATWRSLYWHGPCFKICSNTAAILSISLGIFFCDLQPWKSNFLLEPESFRTTNSSPISPESSQSWSLGWNSGVGAKDQDEIMTGPDLLGFSRMFRKLCHWHDINKFSGRLSQSVLFGWVSTSHRLGRKSWKSGNVSMSRRPRGHQTAVLKWCVAV